MELYATLFSLTGEIFTFSPSFQDFPTCFNFVQNILNSNTLENITGASCLGSDVLERLGVING